MVPMKMMDSHQDLRVRCETVDIRESVRRQLPSGEDTSTTHDHPQLSHLRNRSTCPSMPDLDGTEEKSEKMDIILRRSFAWSQDSLDRRPHDGMTSVHHCCRSNSLLIDSKYGHYESLEDSPTSTWVYWEEHLDTSSDFLDNLGIRRP
jgi:hypothetical protein